MSPNNNREIILLKSINHNLELQGEPAIKKFKVIFYH